MTHSEARHIVGCNPCDQCSMHIAACPWLHRGEAVPGWEAERSLLPYQPRPVETWHILRCPLYLPPKPRKTIIPTPNKETD
ncbi:MAG: hypothetical protein IIW96_07630 [Oscillibacter sp.]|nr:hypothetical protein [Oscillibacter sp.]